MGAFQFWQRWLVYSNIGFAFFGLLVAFAGDTFIFELHNAQTRDVFFMGGEIPPNVLLLKKFLFGIIGGTLAGSHLLMAYIAHYPLAGKKRWAHRALLYALLLWFIADSSVSIATGALYNVYLINIVALVVIGIPLIIIWKDCKGH